MAARGAKEPDVGADPGDERFPYRTEGVTTIAPAPLHLPTRMQVSTPWTTSVPHLAKPRSR